MHKLNNRNPVGPTGFLWLADTLNFESCRQW